MFGALRFAEGGSSVLLLARGGAENRHYHVEIFRHRKLDPESNVVYGEGEPEIFLRKDIHPKTRRRIGLGLS